MSTGILRIQTFTARQAGALPGVAVTVTGDGFTQSFVTDQEGNAPDLLLPAPDAALSFGGCGIRGLPAVGKGGYRGYL